MLTIRGTGFDASNPSKNVVEADGLACTILTATPTMLTCRTSSDPSVRYRGMNVDALCADPFSDLAESYEDLPSPSGDGDLGAGTPPESEVDFEALFDYPRARGCRDANRSGASELDGDPTCLRLSGRGMLEERFTDDQCSTHSHFHAGRCRASPHSALWPHVDETEADGGEHDHDEDHGGEE